MVAWAAGAARRWRARLALFFVLTQKKRPINRYRVLYRIKGGLTDFSGVLSGGNPFHSFFAPYLGPWVQEMR
jgi:hypothetical protein